MAKKMKCECWWCRTKRQLAKRPTQKIALALMFSFIIGYYAGYIVTKPFQFEVTPAPEDLKLQMKISEIASNNKPVIIVKLTLQQQGRNIPFENCQVFVETWLADLEPLRRHTIQLGVSFGYSVEVPYHDYSYGSKLIFCACYKGQDERVATAGSVYRVGGGSHA